MSGCPSASNTSTISWPTSTRRWRMWRGSQKPPDTAANSAEKAKGLPYGRPFCLPGGARSVWLVRIVQGMLDLRPAQADVPQLPVAEAEQHLSRGLALCGGDPGRQPVVDAVAEIGRELPGYWNSRGRAGNVGNHGHGLSSCLGLASGENADTMTAVREKDFQAALICCPPGFEKPPICCGLVILLHPGRPM